jgi:hypothetical protein
MKMTGFKPEAYRYPLTAGATSVIKAVPERVNAPGNHHDRAARAANKLGTGPCI